MHLDLLAQAAPEMLSPDLRAAVGRLDPADVAAAEHRPHDHRHPDADRRAAAIDRIAAILLETLNSPNAR